LYNEPVTIPEALSVASQLQRAGRLAESEQVCRQILRSDARQHAALNILGKIGIQTGQNPQAVAIFQQAIALEPRMAEYHGNLGLALLGAGRAEESVAASRAALAIDPKSTPPYNNLALALNRLGRPDEAIGTYRAALKIRPDYFIAMNNLGDLLGTLGEVEEAVELFRRAIAIRPDYPPARSNLLLYLNYLPGVTPRSIFEEHQRWNADFTARLQTPGAVFANDRSPQRRLKMGYVSPDFHDTSVSRFLLPLMEHHDHEQFEIFCFSDVVVPDKTTARFKGYAGGWHSLLAMSADAAAALVRQLNIDILVDLTGHTANNRLTVFARKPAPIQVSYLGYPCTTGISAIDYRLTDAMADSPGLRDGNCTEKLIRLPRTAWCFEPPEAAVRAQILKDRPPGPIRFGSFNNFAKVSNKILALWMEILQAVPGSELWVKASALSAATARNKLTAAMKSSGLDERQLRMIPFEADLQKHFELYNQIDVALDTFPYHGTTTTCDALWMGVPVVTLAGDAHVSRVGVSLLNSVGLENRVASSAVDYVANAVKLARDEAQRSDLRRGLRQKMENSPLMDGRGLARSVQAAFREMWVNWCKLSG
jgi:protein O-GlcNAc transferase